MAPWLQSALVYGFLGASLAFGLWRLWPRRADRNRIQGPIEASIAPGLALAAPFALEQGGAGALLWSLVGVLGGLALMRPKSALGSTRLSRGTGLLFALSALALAGVMAALIGQQGLVVLRDLVPDTRVFVGLLRGPWLLLLAAMVLIPLGTRRGRLANLSLVASLLWIGLCATALLTSENSTTAALQAAISTATQSAQFVTLSHEAGQPLLAALFCMASAGIVAAMWAHPASWRPNSALQGADKAPAVLQKPWLRPLLGALGLALTMLLLLDAGLPHLARIDDPKLRKAPAEHLGLESPPRWLPLERPHTRSFAATSVGQSVVLPTDSPLKQDEEYKLLFRSNPRGSRIGQLTPRGNGLFIPYPWRTLHKVTHIRFRDKNPKRSSSGAWDLRIPVEVTLLGSDLAPRGVVYTPKNPKVVLKDLSESMEGPFVELSDQEVIASPQRMHSSQKELGIHDALLAYASHPENTFAPSLRDLVGSLKFRGPYLAGRPGQRPPFAMVAADTFQGEAHSQRELFFQTPARGLAIGDLEPDGSYVTPPWEHLAKSKSIVFRHKEHPHLDLEIPASVKLVGGRLHFYPDSPQFNDLRSLARNPEYEGPFLRAPDYHFSAEVHSGTNFPDVPGTPFKERGLKTGPLANRASLVPLHPLPEPVGASTKLYRPHPAELASTDAQGPYLATRGASWILRSFGQQGAWMRTLAQGLLLALMALGFAALSRRCAQSMRGLLGKQAQWIGAAVALGCAALGSFASWAALSHALMLAATGTFLAQLLASLSSLRKHSAQ